MGCDIHSYVEVKRGDRWSEVKFHPFDDRCYAVFAFLADVRNYSAVPCIAEPRGLPEDLSFMVRHEADHWGVTRIRGSRQANWWTLTTTPKWKIDATSARKVPISSTVGLPVSRGMASG